MRFKATLRNRTGASRQIEFDCAHDATRLVEAEAMKHANAGEIVRGEIVRIDPYRTDTALGTSPCGIIER